jgi:hypothetical protein
MLYLLKIKLKLLNVQITFFKLLKVKNYKRLIKFLKKKTFSFFNQVKTY